MSTGLLSFRRATAADLDTLAALARRTFHDTYAPFNKPDNLSGYMDEAFSKQTLGAHLADGDYLTTLSYAGDQLAGYFQLRQHGDTPAHVQQRPAVELTRFYVDRSFHGKGVAQGQLQAMLELAGDRAKTCWLCVWDQNPRAIRFYEKSGFEDIGVVNFQLGDELQTDRLMQISL